MTCGAVQYSLICQSLQDVDCHSGSSNEWSIEEVRVLSIIDTDRLA